MSEKGLSRLRKNDIIEKYKELLKENELLKSQLEEIFKKEYNESFKKDYDWEEIDIDLTIEKFFNKYELSYKYLDLYTYDNDDIEQDFYIYKLNFNEEFKKYNMTKIITYLLSKYYNIKYDDIIKKETLIIIEKEKNKEYLLIIQRNPFIDNYRDFNDYINDVLTFINRLCNIHTYQYLNNIKKIMDYKDDNKYKILYYVINEKEKLINKHKELFKIIDNYYKEKNN